MEKTGEINGFGHNYQVTSQVPPGQPPLEEPTKRSLGKIQDTYKYLEETAKKLLGENYPLRGRVQNLPQPPLNKQVPGPFVPPENLMKRS